MPACVEIERSTGRGSRPTRRSSRPGRTGARRGGGHYSTGGVAGRSAWTGETHRGRLATLLDDADVDVDRRQDGDRAPWTSPPAGAQERVVFRARGSAVPLRKAGDDAGCVPVGEEPRHLIEGQGRSGRTQGGLGGPGRVVPSRTVPGDERGAGAIIGHPVEGFGGRLNDHPDDGPRAGTDKGDRGRREATRAVRQADRCPAISPSSHAPAEIDFGPDAGRLVNRLDEVSPVWFVAMKEKPSQPAHWGPTGHLRARWSRGQGKPAPACRRTGAQSRPLKVSLKG